MDPKTGDYIVENGKPVIDSGLTTAAFIRLKTHRTQWLYAPDNQYGSDFYLVKKRHTNSDAKLLETIANRALQPIIDDGRAADVTNNTDFLSDSASQMKTTIIDAEGNNESLTVKPIGR